MSALLPEWQWMEAVLKRRQAEVTEARIAIREAIQLDDRANVIWWEKALRTRQAFVHQWQEAMESRSCIAK